MKNRYGYILPAIFCNILWGSAIPFINIGYRLFGIESGQTGSQILFAGTRFLLAGLLTLLIHSVQLGRPALPRRESWPKAAELSVFQTILQYLFFYIGVANTVSVKASIIQGLGAFVSILIASFVFRYEKMDARKWLGGLLGILGIIVVNWRSGGLSGSISFAGEGCLILSMVSAAFSAGLIKRFGQKEDPVTLSGWQFILGSLFMILTGLLMGGRLHPQSAAAFAVLFYLAFLSAAAYSVWALLLKTWPVSRIAVFMFLQPLFGVILGILLVRQKMDIPPLQYLAALILICLCIVIVNGRGSRD